MRRGAPRAGRGRRRHRRVRAAVALLTLGGVVLVVEQGQGGAAGWQPGLLAVALATGLLLSACGGGGSHGWGWLSIVDDR